MMWWIVLGMVALSGCHMQDPGPPLQKCRKIASVPGKVLTECSHTLDGDR